MAAMLLPTGPDGLRRFTRESMAALEQRIAQERAKEAKEAKEAKDCPAAHRHAEPSKPRIDLEAGKQLPRIFGEIPTELIGVPLEDIDPFYYKNQRVGASLCVCVGWGRCWCCVYVVYNGTGLENVRKCLKYFQLSICVLRRSATFYNISTDIERNFHLKRMGKKSAAVILCKHIFQSVPEVVMRLIMKVSLESHVEREVT